MGLKMKASRLRWQSKLNSSFGKHDAAEAKDPPTRAVYRLVATPRRGSVWTKFTQPFSGNPSRGSESWHSNISSADSYSWRSDAALDALVDETLGIRGRSLSRVPGEQCAVNDSTASSANQMHA